MEHDRIEGILQAWRAAWGKGDIDAFEKILAPGYVRHTRSGVKTIDDIRQEINDSRIAFPDLDTQILQTVEQGDTLAIRWTSFGSHTGTFMNVPPTQKDVSVMGASFLRFSDGLLAEEWVVWDPRELLAAMKIWAVGDDE